MSDTHVFEASNLQEKSIERTLSTSVGVHHQYTHLQTTPLTFISTHQPDRRDDIEANPIYDIHHNSLQPRTNALQRWAYKLEGLAGVEARGIERVPESLRAKETTFADYGTLHTDRDKVR